MATATNSTTSPSALLRDLGASQAVSIVVGVVIGSGIFLVPAEMMQAAGSARLVYLAWIVGGIFSFFGAVTYAQLGAMKPQSGGEYVYIRDAYGPLAGFLTGWTWTVVVKPSSLAAISTGIVRVLANFPSLHFLAARMGNIPLTWGQLVAMGFVIFVSFVNYVGVRRAGNFQLAFTVLKVVLIVAISALAFGAHGSWSHFAERYPGAIGGVAGFFAALTAALWAYDGWSDLNMVAEEVRDPGAERSPGAGGWDCGDWRTLHAGQRRCAIRAAGGVRCAIFVTYVGRGACVVPGGGRSSRGLGGNGDFVDQFAEWRGHERIANGICTGSRWKLLFGFGKGAPTLPYAACGDYFSGRPINMFPSDRGEFSPAVHAGHFCGMALICGRQQFAFCVSQKNGGPGAAASVLAISNGSSVFYCGFGGPSLLHFHQQLTILGHGNSGDPGGYSGLLRIRSSS